MEGATFRREDVARHSGTALVIDNVVYEVGEFLLEHPGGSEALLAAAGGDASRCFHDVGHSEYARDWMKSFAIGEVVEEQRREVEPWPPSVIDADAEAAAAAGAGAGGLRAVLSACSAPLVMAFLALAFYAYLLAPEPAL